MAFFDIGINVSVNLGNSLASLNQLRTAMAGFPAATNQAVGGFRALQQAEAGVSTSTTNTVQVFNNLGQRVQSLGQQFSALTGPTNQAAASVQKFSATVSQIQNVSGAPLANLNNQLGQTSQSMDKATSSGNRLTEIFRGNRGLVFGASAFIGTLTGIDFELQLVNDANKQVAASQAHLNDLTAQGKEGSAQYSQAQQALAKDQRFLEFSTRNLSLAFTNLIPDLLLITNGILSLGQKLAPAGAAMTAVGGAAQAAGAGFTTMGTEAAAGVAPLAGLGVAGEGAAAGMGEATAAAGGLRAALMSFGPVIAVFAALGAIVGFVMLSIADLAKQQQAADPVYRRLMGVQDEMAANTASLADSMSTAAGAMEQSVKTMADNIASHYQKLITDTLTFAKDIKDASQGKVETFGPPAPQVGARGLTGGTSMQGLPTMPSQSELEKTKGITPKGFIGPMPQAKVLTPMEQFNAMQAQIGAQESTLITKMRQPGELFSQLPANLPLTIDMISKGNDLWSEWLTITGKIHDEDGKATPDQILRLASIKDQLVDLVTGKSQEEKATKAESQAQKEANKAYADSQKSMDAYNATLDKLPIILQDTGAMTKKLSEEEQIRQGIIRTSAAVFIGQAEAQKVSLGVAQQVAEQGNKLTGGLIQQRDAIIANNLIWAHMDTIVAGTTQTMGQWITTQQQVALANIDVTQALTNQTKNQYLVNQGMIAGKQAAQGMLEQMISGEAENKQFVASATEIATMMGVTIPQNMQLTREEFTKLFQSIQETGGAGAFFADQLNNRIAPAVQLLGKALNAKDWKEFQKGFKDIEFGDTSGKLVSKFKDFDNMLRKVNEDGRELNSVFQQMNLMESLGKLDPKTFVKGLTEMEDKVKQIAKLQGIDLSNIINFLEEMKKTKDPTQLEKFKTVFALISADAQDGYTSAELREINDAINKVDPQPIVKLEGALSGMLVTVKEFKKLGPLGSIISTGPTPGQEGEAIPMTWDEFVKSGGHLKYKPVNAPGTDNKKTPTSAEIEQLGLNTGATKGDTKSQETTKQVAANNQLDRTIKQLIIDTNLYVKANNTFDSTVAQIITDVGLWVKQNNLLDRTFRQMIIDENIWVKQNNLFDSTVAQIIIDVGLWIKTNNILDKTVAQLIIDTNLWVKANNTLDVTVAQLIIDVGLMVKQNNIYARTLLVVASDTDTAAKSTKSFTSALASLESQAKATTKALEAEAAAAKKAAAARSSGGGSSGGSGPGHQHGLHTTLNEDTLLFAHRGEEVNIDTVGATISNKQMRARGGGDTTINLTVNTVNELDGEAIGTTVTRKTFRKLNTR